jgi:hypothetical protein
MMNPKMVAQNRTARLVREAKTPAYTSETPKASERDHLEMVQLDDGAGTWWSGPFKSSQMRGVLAQYDSYGYGVVDIDCSAKCWCAQ